MSCSKTKSKSIRALRSKALCRSRTLSLPQALQRWISLWTPCPHDLQGTGILLPLRILARWILQYSPRQLFPQILVSPLLSHSQLFDPFIFTIYLTLTFFLIGAQSTRNYLVAAPAGYCCCFAALVGGPPGGWSGPFVWSTLSSLVVHMCRPGVYMQNCLASACTKKVFFLHAELG